jgi:hypothetical protein|tara:strand:- start:2753 stop:3109 length:357 start_codon:yes stop_codon:yes gene_type:complete
MKDIILEVIILLLLICIITLIVIQIRKTYNINNILTDTTNMLEDFNNNNLKETFTSSGTSEKCSDTCQHPYINLTSRLDTLERDMSVEKIQLTQNTVILNKIRDNVNKLAKVTGNPAI